MKLETLTGEVLHSTFNNFAEFTVKHLFWCLFLINLNLFCWICPSGCLRVKWTQKNCAQENTFDDVLFSAVADIWANKLFKKELYHRCFSMKIGKFYRTSILQNNAARLLLISCAIFNALLALSVLNQLGHSMEI